MREYKILSLVVGENDVDTMTKQLNKEAADGWRVQYVVRRNNILDGVIVFLRRAKKHKLVKDSEHKK